MNVAHCKHRFKYLLVDRDGLFGGKSQASVLYADDVCLIASNEQDMQRIFDSISGCISEYNMNVSEKPINGDLYKWSEERENVEFLWK